MNDIELQTIEEDLRNAIENLLNVEAMLSLLSTQEPDQDDSNTKHCIALARDVLSDATNDLKNTIDKPYGSKTQPNKIYCHYSRL